MTQGIERTLFDAASNIVDGEERRAFLDHTCRDDPRLRARLDGLLKVTEVAEAFFEFQPEVTTVEKDCSPAVEEGIGAHIGRYRLIERIGAGGCGVVYLAEQQQPVRRKVALKIIRLGMDTENEIARFGIERQSLALMDHPNIARVLDAGATAAGRPYFVMELVDGEKITEFCDKNRLSIRQRLELFVQVCNGIQHAHQKGVIHRDIKPSNVLVHWQDGIALPKIIDFGIAKATAGNAEDDATFTAIGQFLGTPAYMSPEQAEGGVDMDTRSDIYSLGVLLYELLSGRPPFEPQDLKDRGMEAIRRNLREMDPVAPSVILKNGEPEKVAAAADRRGTDAHRLLAQVEGDLDWITMKAMEKDRQRRYETVNGLAMDVLRYLGNEPIMARPPSRRYRLGKLVRRNRIVFAAGSIAAFCLLAGFGTSTWLFFRERNARQEQARLRDVAERARANETGLRQRAEIREKIARAAVMVKYGNLQQADELVADIPAYSVLPSLEGASTFSALGEWHVSQNRWPEAAARLAAQVYSLTGVDASDSDNVSRDILPAASAAALAGEQGNYDGLRRVIVEHFGHTTHPVVAEQVLKSSLLLPADPGILESLEPLGGILTDAVSRYDAHPGKEDSYMAAWRVFALALFDYRRGNFETCVERVDHCLAYPSKNLPRTAGVRLVGAMALHRLGRHGEAVAELGVAKELIGPRMNDALDLKSSIQGFWYDWVNARLLYREAVDLIGKSE